MNSDTPRTATKWADDCGMMWSTIGDSITVNQACLTLLVQENDQLRARIAKMQDALDGIQKWYERDGSVGGLCEPIDAVYAALNVKQ